MIKLFLPPVLTVFVSNFLSTILNKPRRRDILFDGDEGFFTKLIEQPTVYGEYGFGASSRLAYRNEKLYSYCVESEKAWALATKNLIKSQRHIVHWVDL